MCGSPRRSWPDMSRPIVIPPPTPTKRDLTNSMQASTSYLAASGADDLRQRGSVGHSCLHPIGDARESLVVVASEQSQQRRRPACRDFRSARRSDRPRSMTSMTPPTVARPSWLRTGPVGACSKSTVQQTSGAVATAQTSSGFDAGGVAAPSAKQPSSSRSRFRPLVAAFGQRQPRPRGDGRRVLCGRNHPPTAGCWPGNAPCKNARLPMQSRPGRSGTKAPPTDPQLAPLVTGMSPKGSRGPKPPR